MRHLTMMSVILLWGVQIAQSAEQITLENLKITSYRSVPNQTDETPWITSIGHRTSQTGIAVSPDLLRSGQLCYGDAVYIQDIGMRIVNDVTNERLKRTIDVWVLTLKDERAFGIKRKDVTVFKSPLRYCKKGY